MEKDKLLDYMFDQNRRLMAQLSGIQEELRLVREGEEVRYKALASRLECVLEELVAAQRAAALERSRAEEARRLAARETEAKEKAERLVEELTAQLASMAAKLESMADSSEVDALRKQIIEVRDK